MLNPLQEKLMTKIKRILVQYSRAACAQVRVEWSKYDDADGEALIDFEVEDAEALVVATIFAEGQKAWTLEFGKGSKMEKSTSDNPFLEEYLNGNVGGYDGVPFFNPERLSRGLAILGRPKGTYLDLDSRVHRSSGSMEGWNLEEASGNFPRLDINAFRPRRIIKNVLFGQNNDGIIAEVNQEIFKAIRDCIFEITNVFPKKIVISER